MTKRRHDARLAVQVRPHVLVLDLSRVDDLYRHLATTTPTVRHGLINAEPGQHRDR